MKDRPAWFSAGLILFLTWLLFGMYYLTRFNFSAVIPLLKADLGISNAQAGGLMGEHLGWRSSFIIPPLMMAATALIFWILVRDPAFVLNALATLSLLGLALYLSGSGESGEGANLR